jgi:phytol kinase
MNQDYLNTAILAGFFLMLFGKAELLYHYMKVKVEITRKIVHVGTGLLTMLFPVMLANQWLVLLLCSSFAVLLVFTLKFGLLKSVNAIERESVGSIAYPVSVYISYLAFEHYGQQYIYFYLPILILAFCDPIAAFTGKKWPMGKYRINNSNKTLMGTAMFFTSALAVCFFLAFFSGIKITASIALLGIAISFVSALVEAASGRGYDNLTIPLSVLAVLFLANAFF